MAWSAELNQKKEEWLAHNKYMHDTTGSSITRGRDEREALLKLFDRATKVANPKKLHLTLAGIYERSGQDDMAAQTLKTATRRFGQSAKVWLAHIRAQILHVGDKNADPESVRKALLLFGLGV